ncbi:Ankyrin repeat-containing protein BDA1 [Camellia lanceoleosa]|uniref:Ankyrin repeat-containing protein BDA1 n=1 Tax=Camellia lanceoleosa TaxID=1840588 RepID=A0ACC0FKF0_9ERIC|nr:Ankyrin repeat-containing protein BDA1 [Camellia lanceoleosa]
MEEIQQKLLKAAIEGDTPLLVEMHTQNPLILNRVTVGCFYETPLHVAALRGHVEFARKLVSLDSELAQVLDSQGSSPLHLASAKGYIQIVKLLVAAKPEMCKVLDRDGFNPLHLAAIKGKVEVLRELVGKMPQAALPKLNHRQTILHLCVKHFQMDALKLLMEETDDVQILGLVNATDDYGYTILHLAVADKQIRSRRGVEDWEIGNSVQEAGGLKAADIPLSGNGNRSARPSNMLSIVHDQSRTPLPAQTSNNLRSQTAAATLPSNGSNNPQIPSFLRHDTTRSSAQGDQSKHKLNDQGQWLAKKRDALMVVASLLATMAFQAVVNPPGGVWQDDKPVDSQVQG